MKKRNFLKQMVSFVLAFAMVTGCFAQMPAITVAASQTQVADEVPIENPTKEVTEGSVFDAEAEGYATGLTEEYMEAMEADAKEANTTDTMSVMSVAEDEELPESVDNTQPMGPNNRTYFPEIGNQKSIGSCWAWSETYYQLTYAINRYHDREVAEDNIMSPKYNYYMTFVMGASGFCSDIGSLSIKDIPLDNFDTEANMYNNPIDIKATEEKQLEALSNKMTFEKVENNVGRIKELLADGEILGYISPYTSWITKQVPKGYAHSGELIIASELEGFSSGHAITIVGYDDNVACDLDGDSSISSDEKGAFKVANSWGNSWGNSGFVWISYDAFRKESNVKLSNGQKRLVPSVERGIYNGPYTPEYYQVVTVEASDVNDIFIGTNVTMDRNSYSLENIVSSSDLLKRNYQGTIGKKEATFVTEMEIPREYKNEEDFVGKDMETILEENKWSVQFWYPENSDFVVKEVHYVNNKKGEIYGAKYEWYRATDLGKIIKTAVLDKSVITPFIRELNVVYNSAKEQYKITCNASDDKEGLQYRFYVEDKDGVITELQEYSSSNEIESFFENMSQVCVDVKDSEGNVVTKKTKDGLLSFKLEELEFTADKVSPVSISDSINLTAVVNTESQNYEYRFGTIFNGKEKILNLSGDYSSSNTCNVRWRDIFGTGTAEAVGTHTLFVDVRDTVTGVVARKTIKNYKVEGLRITSFKADKVSPQKLGTSINLSVEVENEASYRYNTYKFSVVKDGVETTISSYSSVTYSTTWTPKEAGTYTLKYYIKDYLGQEASAEMEYTVYSEETAFVYYNNASWNSANIHYKVGNGTWTTAPGVAMERSNLEGYTWCYAIDLGNASNATVCFNNGNNTWDSNGGLNYTVTKGLNGIGGEELAFSIKSITGTPVKQAPCYSITLSGGIAPYTYGYEIIDRTTGDIVNFGENCTLTDTYLSSPYGPRKSGEYTLNITFTDSYGQTATASKDYTLEPFTISDITANVTSPQLPNTEITLTAQYENAFIYKYGLINNWTITNKTTNKTENYTSYYTRELNWTPTEIGEYEITVSATDNNGETATHTINYSVVDEIRNEATVYYYNSSWANAYIHYRVGDGSWTTVPGVKMASGSEQSGYKWKYVIDLEDADLATVCFNNGSGSWDSNNGSNYTVSAGVSGIKSGAVNKLTPILTVTPTVTPTSTPTATPTVKPTSTPTATPTVKPTSTPTVKPTSTPTATPTVKPTSTPTATPTPAVTKTTVYYSNSSWTQAYIHYKVGNGNWTTAPGVKMEDNTSDNGYTWKYVIDLGDADNTTVCFNNGNGSWDSKNGSNYPLNAGSYGIENETTEELPEGLNVSVEITGTRGSSSAHVTVEDGVAPYTYSYVYTRNGENPQEITNTSSLNTDAITITSYDGGTYKVDVVVTDAEGKTGTATTTRELPALYIASISSDVASPQKTGTTVTFTADIQSEYVYKFSNYRNWTISKDGVEYKTDYSSSNVLTYTFEEEGTYEITCTLTDASGQTATKTVQFVVSDATNVATIYYNTTWSNAYIHYCVAGGSWTSVPGVAMTATSEKSGYTHKYVIDLDEAENVVVCFNNGSGTWDSKNGSNYTINAGTYGVSNGSISKVN